MSRSQTPSICIVAACSAAAVGFAVFLSLKPADRSQPAISPKPAPANDPVRPLVGTPAASSLVYSILQPGKTADYRQLISRIDGLPDSLTEPESMLICRALKSGLPEVKAVLPPERHHIANQLLDALLRQEHRGEWLAEELAAVWQSTKADETIRDYALQHLAQLLEKRPRSPASTARYGKWVSDGMPVMLAAARAVHARSAGTAMIGLTQILAANGHTPWSAKVKAELVGLIESTPVNPAAHPAPKAAALQLAANLDGSSLLPEARRLAGASATAPGVRIAALHYLGSKGSSADIPLLTAVKGESDLRFTPAASSAADRLAGLR